MDPLLIPQPDATPVSWGWFQFLLLLVGFYLSNNMLLLVSPGRFAEYSTSRLGTLLAVSQAEFWTRYLHMVTGSPAMRGLFVGLLGRYKKRLTQNWPSMPSALVFARFVHLPCSTPVSVCGIYWRSRGSI